MGRHTIKIGVLTSSRADYCIYRPLLFALQNDARFTPYIIAFGTHLSPHYGMTIDNIRADGFEVPYTIPTTLASDDEESVATSYALTAMKFSSFWASNKSKFDLVLCLGDRYEMAAAVFSGIPFQISFAHLHGGETTLGAIDEVYRHGISLASKIHFTATEIYAKRVKALIGTDLNVFVSGALGLETPENIQLPDRNTFLEKFNIPDKPYILITVHPETTKPVKANSQLEVFINALKTLAKKINLVITMPNADTNGSIWRQGFNELQMELPEKVILIENFGAINYAAAMSYAEILLGNSSSGIIEAASFGKYVVNLGDRQRGRATSKNILESDFNTESILTAVRKALKKGPYLGSNIYFKKSPTAYISDRLAAYKNDSSL